MGVINSNKELSLAQISCGGSLNVTLSLVAEPDITTTPADIVLVLNRSQNMAESLDTVKSVASRLVEIIEGATGTADGEIEGGSRMAIVSFADTATQDTQLITSSADLNAAINALTAGGGANTAAALTEALDLFDPASANSKVIVVISDGVSTAGGDAAAEAGAAKAIGASIYAIGIPGASGISLQPLRDWSSDPDSAYVTVFTDDRNLDALFANLVANAANPGAENVVITDTVSPCFRITSLTSPTKGTATIINSNTVQWTIDELGVAGSEGAALTFAVEHLGDCVGDVTVNESVDYNDTTGNTVTFPSPAVMVSCDVVISPEGCSAPVDIEVAGCTDAIEFDAGDITLTSDGQIVQLDVTLQNVCPGRRVAFAAVLNEVDAQGNEVRRGVKTFTIPAQSGSICQDITVRCINFVVPERLESAPGTPVAACESRLYRARFIAHYIDSNFNCCEE